MIRLPRSRAVQAGLIASAAGLCVAASTGLESCAYVSAPPGGPPDSIPPILIAVQPDSYSVNPGFEGEVRFEFAEAISERGIDGSVILYPFEARPRLKKGKQELKVRPREGWVDDRIYHVQVLPVIQDLFNNMIKEPIYYVFSTGVPIPDNGVRGTVFDRITGRPLTSGRVDMVQLPDSLRYGGVTDTAGAFLVGALPVAGYLAIGYEDVNGNKRADEFDRSDTVRVQLGADDVLAVEFQVFRHDTLGPQLARVKPIDTMTVELEFSSYLDPDVPLTLANVEMFGAVDTAAVSIDTVLHAWQYPAWRDSVEQVRRALADSLAELARADSLAALAAADTLQEVVEADTLEAAAPAQVEEPEEQLEGEQEEVEEPARLPDRRIYVISSARIPADAQVVRVRNVRSLSGLMGGGELIFQPPAPEPEDEEPPGEPPG